MAARSSYNILSHRQMDIPYCTQNTLGSAVQPDCSVSAMPPYLQRTFVTPAHSGTVHTLRLRCTP
jgi:hypothetical protein